MLKSVYRALPVALCLAAAAGLSACTNEADVTATPAAGESERSVRTAEVERAASSSDEVVPDLRSSLDDQPRRSAREARDELRSEPTPIRESARREVQAESQRPSVITAEPSLLDVGSMPAGETRSGTVRLTNTSDTVVTLLDSRTSCGCTVANVPKGQGLAPGESVDVEVSLRSNASRAERLTKTVTFIFDDHPNVVARVTGESITYVTLAPHITDRDSNPDGRLVLTSSDGEPFRVVGVRPLLAADFSEEPATEHEIFLAWDQWEELRQPRRFEILIDHPMAQSVSGSIRAPRAAPVARDQQRDATTASRETRPQREVPLHTLAQGGNVEEIVKRLADGGDVEATDPQGNSLLSIAAKNGNVELMKALVEAGAKIDSFSVRNGVTPLMNASQSRNAEAVRFLVEAGADVNATDTVMGATALSWAAMGGNADMVRTLLDAGAKVDVVAQATGWTPLICAAFGETEVLKLLIEAGGQLESHCSIQGATALMYAVGTGRHANVEALLAAGADVTAKDSSGHSVLIFGARAAGADADTLRMLIEAGADVHATDRRGLNALDHARARDDARRDAVIALLEPYFEEAAAQD